MAAVAARSNHAVASSTAPYDAHVIDMPPAASVSSHRSPILLAASKASRPRSRARSGCVSGGVGVDAVEHESIFCHAGCR